MAPLPVLGRIFGSFFIGQDEACKVSIGSSSDYLFDVLCCHKLVQARVILLAVKSYAVSFSDRFRGLQVFDETKSRDSDDRAQERYSSARYDSR